MLRRVSAVITQEGGLYVAQCLEVDVASQGTTVEEAAENLREALELYFEDVPSSAVLAKVIHLDVNVPASATG